jgi:hypothetical protein
MMAWTETPEMKRFDPSSGIPEGADAITRLDPPRPAAAMARLRVAAFDVSSGAGSAASNQRTAHADRFRDSRSTLDTGRA